MEKYSRGYQTEFIVTELKFEIFLLMIPFVLHINDVLISFRKEILLYSKRCHCH